MTDNKKKTTFMLMLCFVCSEHCKYQ